MTAQSIQIATRAKVLSENDFVEYLDETIFAIRAEARVEAADRGWQALKKTGCPLGITYSAFYEEVTGEKYNPLG
jgi:hypothetical protein